MNRAAAVALLLAFVATSCGGSDAPAADQAIIRTGNREVTVDLTSCGIDGDTIFLVGERDGVVLQLVVGAEQVGEEEVDGEIVPVLEGDPAATGVTVDFGGTGDILGAFGDVAYERADGPDGQQPGEIGEVRLEGSHIVVTVRAQPVDETGVARVDTNVEPTPITVDANCPETESA